MTSPRMFSPKNRSVSSSPFWIVSPATPFVAWVAETQSSKLLVIKLARR